LCRDARKPTLAPGFADQVLHGSDSVAELAAVAAPEQFPVPSGEVFDFVDRAVADRVADRQNLWENNKIKSEEEKKT
jgi:hypothetical protein